MKLINKSLINNNIKLLEVKTVDGFQGREKDIIILSCVRTSDIGFLNDINRFIVSLTRGRHILIIVGNVKVLRHNKLWKYNIFIFSLLFDYIIEKSKSKESIKYFKIENQKRKYSNTSAENYTNKKAHY